MFLSGFKEGKFPHCLKKKKWERLTWELRAIRSNGDKIPLKHCWHAYCTQVWYVYSQIRQTLPTREATLLVLVYLHTQSSVKIMLRLWSYRRYERFGKCFLAFGDGGKTMKMFIYQSQSGIRRERVASPFFSFPVPFPFPLFSFLLFPPSFCPLLPFFSSPSHHCLITTI